ncbi:hypothetical protein L6R53_18170 [Myxococcota bacterium]|nr:hypothetical protein [Myxococcota bacterium]
MPAPTALLVLVGGVACAAEPALPPPAPLPAATGSPVLIEAPMRIETIDETTVGDLGGVRVPMGNMTTGTYTLPDGSEGRGTICSLALPGQVGVFVGLGSVVDVQGTRWEVIGIEKPPGQLGSVTLRRLDG